MTDLSRAPAAHVRMDLLGQACATLTPIIASRMRQLESGQVLEVVSDDPTARSAVVEDGSGRTRYYLRRK